MSTELQALIDAQRKQSFRPEYQATVSDANALGILVAHHLHWDGDAILEMAAAALQDANFDHEAMGVRRLRRLAGVAS